MLLGFEGFDNLPDNDSSDNLSRLTGFIQIPPSNGGGPFVKIVRPGRNGLGGAVFVSSLLSPFGLFQLVFAKRMTEFVIGIAAKTFTGFSPPSDDSLIMLFQSTLSGGQFIVQFSKVNGKVLVFGGDVGLGEFVPVGPTLFTSASGIFTPDVHNYIEVKAKIHPTDGYIVVQLTPPGEKARIVVNLQGIRTQYATDNLVDSVAYGHPWFGTADMEFDDLYVEDEIAGPGNDPCNDFLGDMTVLTNGPIGNDTAQWTPLANANFVEVNEAAFDGDVSYNYTQTPGARDSFNFPALKQTVSYFYGLQIKGAYRKDDAGFREIAQFLKIGATRYYAPTRSLPDTYYPFYVDFWRLNPATSAEFTDRDYNALAAGYELTA